MLTIEPGGNFPLWTDPGQPAVMFVESGAVMQARSDEGGVKVIPSENGSVFGNGVQAWWLNSADVAAVLHIGAIEPIEVTAGITNPSHSDQPNL